MDWWLTGAVLGAFSGVWIDPSWPIWPLIVLTFIWLILGYILPAFRFCTPFSRTETLFMGALCGILWALINARFAVSWSLPESDYRQSLQVTVTVTEIVAQNDWRWRIDGILLQGPEHWQLNSQWKKPKVRLNWYAAEGELPKLGETWLLQVRLRPAAGLMNQGSFNYQAYLVRKGIRATGSIQQAEYLDSPRLPQPRQYIFDYFEQYQAELIHAGVLLALTLGERQWLSNEDWRLLQQTGVAHLMAISGLHLSMVFASSWLIFRWLLALLPRKDPTQQYNLSYQALVVAWLLALTYAALAGFAVATLRALLLITVAVFYRLLARRITTHRLLLRVLAAVLVLDPLAWLDTGFWLSFVAVLAIFSWLWRLPHHAQSRGWKHSLLQLWRLEVMLTLLLWPLSVFFFQGLSLLAPLSNLLIIPLFSFVILPAALLAVLLLLLQLPGSYFLLKLADQVLQFVWWALEVAGQWSWIWFDGWPLTTTLLLFAALLLSYLPLSLQRRALLMGAFLCSALSWHWQRQQDTSLYLHMLDVGQGSALVVQRGDRAVVVDAGPAYVGGFDLGQAVVVPFLQRRGLTPDYLILSHSHQDHTGGAAAVRQAYPQIINITTDGKHWPCEWGQVWLWEEVHINALAPLPGPSFGPNNDSCVIQLSYQGQRILLPGDMERITEFRLLRRYAKTLASDVLLVPHHGSRTSSGEAVLAAIRPKIALISRGYLNRFSMPHEETLQRLRASGARIYDSGESGQVTLRWHKGSWHSYPYRTRLAPYWFNQI
ncbi:DNA internalization-related competence protein ComEC/Rec2 [Aliidiomarina minuta]|uniref:DNA internalization-related competence protein ComEC/Rec2 n=1 Tax=Aliidiomarina minuta TaxID=880057 RepID=A0A432W7A7_9GAMM|nr:DNA internalization-related competence protein ComEC/Rec2 [Aliidiomarina minuta]RUO25955.1 DNA internalization-related competence protein ComEC/Rec2 [Aliidiomarina minuta]